MRLANKTTIFAVTMLAIILAANILPAFATSTAPTTMTGLNGATLCTKSTNITQCNLDKVFIDPRGQYSTLKTGGYTGSNMASVQVIGLINKAMSQTTFPPTPTTATVTISIAVVPGGAFALVDDFLPAGFEFADPTGATILDNGAPAHIVSIFDGFVRVRCDTPGFHTITFGVVSPKWGASFFSQDFARVFYFFNNGFLFGFDFTTVTVFVQGTGSFLMANAMISKPNYYPKAPTATCTA